MPASIEIVRHLRTPAVDRARCARLAAFLVESADTLRRRAGHAPWSALCVILVGDRESGEAHQAVFADPAPTDVITLSYAPTPGSGETGLSGELVVNVERAVAEGRRRAGDRRCRTWGPNHELALYLAHGIDHLTGADDHDPDDRRRMRARELRWLAAADRADLLNGLLPSHGLASSPRGSSGAAPCRRMGRRGLRGRRGNSRNGCEGA